MTRVAVTGGGSAEPCKRNSTHMVTTHCASTRLHPVEPGADYRRADLREFWQTLDTLDGTEMVVHLVAVGMPESHTTHPLLADQHTFAANVLSTYNVFWAAAARGLRRVVWARSGHRATCRSGTRLPATGVVRHDWAFRSMTSGPAGHRMAKFWLLTPTMVLSHKLAVSTMRQARRNS